VLKNPKETAFFMQYAISAKKAEILRGKFAKQGKHIPSVLIASITKSCNLNCTGCYDRARKVSPDENDMVREDWGRIFREALEVGVSVILLAGGEPLMRFDVLEEASLYPAILFPVFTNGTLFDSNTISFFEKHRHIIPIISIEGDEGFTDERRGEGTFQKTIDVMEKLSKLDLLFGVSITVTHSNLYTVIQEKNILWLKEKKCKVLIFVEYVPFENPDLTLNDSEREFLEESLTNIRKKEDIIIISFPGDEKKSAGCLASGRGFFHISSTGSAEPCPFSAYSDMNLKKVSLKTALQSPLFAKLRENKNLLANHKGGCTLFENAKYVEELLYS